MKNKILIGKKYGYLKVISLAKKTKGNLFLAKCICGKTKEINRYKLLNVSHASCGCMQYKWKIVNIIGKRFGRLRVIKFSHKTRTMRKYICICDCGKTITTDSCSLRRGSVKSCGCYQRDKMSVKSRKHGMHGTSIYYTWASMIQRCHNKNDRGYSRYGARNIKVYSKWRKSFSEFFSYVGDRPSPKHQLDRINNNKGYFPGNVRWVTRKENLLNTRRNRLLTFKEKTKTVTEWAKIIGIRRPAIICARIDQLGYSIEKALTTPVRKIFK